MRPRSDRLVSTLALVAMLAVVIPGSASAQDGEATLRDGFEGDRPAWRQERTDTEVKVYAHDRTDRSTREGQRSEHFQFDAGAGSGFYFSYALPKIPVTERLTAAIHVRSDRAGVQILGRVILPNDVDPETKQPSFVLVPGMVLDTANRWTRIELTEIPIAVERQSRVLRLATGRTVSTRGAVLDRLVMNLYGGAGPTEVAIDDLTIGPVPTSFVEPFERSLRDRADAPKRVAEADAPNDGGQPTPPGPGPDRRDESTDGPVELKRNRLTRQGFPMVVSAIRAPGADPEKLRLAGFDVLALPVESRRDEVEAAVTSGLLLMPEFDAGKGAESLDPARVDALIEAFPHKEKVAFWSLGRGLGALGTIEGRVAERDRVRDIAQPLRKRKGYSGLSTGEVVGAFPEYARVPDHIDLIGVAPSGWGTAQSPTEMLRYLEQRRDLIALENNDPFLIAWLPMSPAPVFREAVWGTDRPPSWGVPRVIPEQLRQSAYVALAAGCRGLGFDADLDITLGAGRALLIESAFLNEEVDLFEWLLADPSSSMRMLPCYKSDPPAPPPPATGINGVRTRQYQKKEDGPHPTIRAAAFTTKDKRGTLLLIADYAGGSQFQPPQMALNDLKIDVPAPAGAIAYEISPGDVKVLDSQRAPGGIRISVPEFGPTCLVYITTDGPRVDAIQQAVIRVRPSAVALAVEQAQIGLAWVVEVHRLLADDGHKVPEGDDLIAQATASLKAAQESLERQDYRNAWSLARRANRPLCALMRFAWDDAVLKAVEALKNPDTPGGPVARPGEKKPLPRLVSVMGIAPLTSFATLPQAWVWMDWLVNARYSKNLIDGGDFESPDTLLDEGWKVDFSQIDGVTADVRTWKDGPGRGFHTLKVGVFPKEKADAARLPQVVDAMVAAVRTPPVEVFEREVVRISVDVSMPYPTAPGAGGVIIRDSIGGEPLQFRSSEPVGGWQEVVLYRRVPRDGTLTVTLGYAGRQYALFDNVRIQKVVDRTPDRIAPTPAPIADARPGRRRPR